MRDVEQAIGAVRFGVLKGRFKVRKDFDDPLPAGILESFEGFEG